jgi:low affinity Fe/Cu permease
MRNPLSPLCGSVVRRAPELVGSPLALALVLVVTAAWLVTGPIFGWSGNWLLIPATVTSVGAFLVVFMLQYSQNRDTRAIQLKLDELIRGLEPARTQLVRLEHLSDPELDELEHEFRRLREEAGRPKA